VRSYVCLVHDAGELPRDGEADLRYRGQSFELTLPLHDDLESAFHRAHEEQYGFADRSRDVELVAVRTADVRPGPPIELPALDRRVEKGPVRVDLDGATLWIPHGWVGVRDGAGWMVTRV
jgi:N-methylhydantoinase A/oxoprolinase/acetone carboxylase beta subunit